MLHSVQVTASVRLSSLLLTSSRFGSAVGDEMDSGGVCAAIVVLVAVCERLLLSLLVSKFAAILALSHREVPIV